MAETPVPEYFSRLRTIRSCLAATKYINEQLKVPLAFDYVRIAARKGDLPNRMIGRKRYFSEADIYKWVSSL